MKGKTEKVRRKIVYVLSPLIYKNKTLKIFKKNWFDYLKELYEKGEYFPDLIRFLDLFGFFKNIETFLIESIDGKNDELLNLYENYIDFSKFRQDRFQIIEKLNEQLKNLDPEDQDITKIILKIIRKIQ